MKNEEDIIGYALTQAVRWCDHIYVYDTGSADRSWDIVQELAKQHPQIIPFRREEAHFDDSLRARVFQAYRNKAAAGDWWCRLDADEIYVQDPREFLRAVPPKYHVVWSIHLQFYLTSKESEKLPEQHRISDQSDLPKYYLANSSEPRFFRYRNGLVWESGAWPRHVGNVCPKRILLRHYQYRSPSQIQQRLDTRRVAIQHGCTIFGHCETGGWQDKLKKPEELNLDEGGNYRVDESRLPVHLDPLPRRWVKQVFHALGIWP